MEVNKSYSQAGQDLFAYYINNRNNKGYFLDIGCQDPKEINNTLFLEEKGWTGLLFDIDKKCIDKCKAERKSTAIQTDLTKDNITDFLKKYNTPKIIDYISMDIDSATHKLIERFPWDDYRFKVMTFEHDVWMVGDKLQKRSRILFNKLGYVPVCLNIMNGIKNPYEDWWINPELVNEKVYKDLICEDTNYEDVIKKISNL